MKLTSFGQKFESNSSLSFPFCSVNVKPTKKMVNVN